MTEDEHEIKSTIGMFKEYKLPSPTKSRNRREELEQYFAKKMGWTDKGMHFKLLHLSLKDLEYVRSDCDAAEREGRCAWAAAFRTATGFNKKYQLSTPIP